MEMWLDHFKVRGFTVWNGPISLKVFPTKFKQNFVSCYESLNELGLENRLAKWFKIQVRSNAIGSSTFPGLWVIIRRSKGIERQISSHGVSLSKLSRRARFDF